MRVLHTGDWHIGQTLRGYSRENEHQMVLEQLIGIVAARDVDAMIIAGDVFDSANPSGASLRLFYDTLVRLTAARHGLAIVVTAGNHDAAGRLEAPRALLSALDVHVVGNVRRTGGVLDARQHFVQLRDRAGDIRAELLAVSYPTAACLPTLPRREQEPVSIVRQVEALYRELHEAIRPLRTGAPLIVTGHLHVAGAIESEGAERRILVGGEHAVPTSIFPADAAYVALGHLHKAQAVGRDTIRYCGSLLPLSATELAYAHAVTLLDINGASIASEQIVLQRPVPFLRVPEAGYMRLDGLAETFASLALDTDLPLERRPFIDLRLAREGLNAGFRAEVERIAEGFPVRLVDIKVPPRDADAAPDRNDPLVRLSERAPEELFRLAFERALGRQPAAEHLGIFHQIAAKA